MTTRPAALLSASVPNLMEQMLREALDMSGSRPTEAQSQQQLEEAMKMQGTGDLPEDAGRDPWTGLWGVK